MTTSPGDDLLADTVRTFSDALTAGTRDAFTELLTEDVRWGGERPGAGNECTDRDQAGDHYQELLGAGLTLRVAELEHVDADRQVLVVRIAVHAPDPDDLPPEMTVRLTLRNGLIADIAHLDPPPTVEVLYVEGCPHHAAFLPHLRSLLTDHGISATVVLTRVDSEDDARAHRFLGSPTVRVDGHDIEPGLADRPAEGIGSGAHGLQCRLYSTADGLTGMPPDQWVLDALVADPLQEALIAAVRAGDVATLQSLLRESPRLASMRLPRHGGRTLLHVATDWPGHQPNVAVTIATLVAAGADPNKGCGGDHPETPLHWAASSDDIAAIDALVVAGADLEATGAVIGGGTAMADATAFGQWRAARRLLEHGARTTLFESAALGLVGEVERQLADDPHSSDDVTSSFWGACHGGHTGTAAVLLEHGADIDWVGFDELTPLQAARRSEAHDVVVWLEQHGARP